VAAGRRGRAPLHGWGLDPNATSSAEVRLQR